jgi:hypothetical protein
MALLERYDQQPNDVKNYVLDYSEWLATNETLTSVVYAVDILNEQTGDVGEPTLVVTNTSLVNGNTSSKYYVSGGLDGRDYKVTATATTNDSQTLETEIEFRIREI